MTHTISSFPRLTIPPELDEPCLRSILEIIVRDADPERIVLFGSRARSESQPDSDYDIALFKRGLRNARELTGRLYLALFREGPGKPVDLLAFDTTGEMGEKNAIGSMRQRVVTEGIIVYG